MHSISKTATGIVLAGIFIAAETAFAELEEIVVTARKREEKLQDLPMSVTAVNSEELARLGIRDLADISRYTAGVNLDNGFGLNDQRLVIRGLSPSRGRPNNAVLVDGIDLTTESVSTAGGSMLFNSRLLDIERVEVVKGPQSALYGRAAFTGAIQYITKDPGDELEMDAGIDIGDHGRRYYSGAISGPVEDGIGMRLNAMSWNEDGYYDEGFTGSSLGGGEGYGISLTTKVAPTDNFSARLRVAYSHAEYDQQATFYDASNTTLVAPDSALGVAGITAEKYVRVFRGSPAGADGRQAYLTANPNTGDAYEGGDQDTTNTSLILNWEFARGTITSYTGYVKATGKQFIDGDFDVRPNETNTMDVAAGGTEVDFDADTRLFSQEIRYATNLDGPLQFTLGALYWDEDVDQAELGVSSLARFPNPPTVEDVGFFNSISQETLRLPNNIRRDTESHSVYGIIDMQLAEQWKFSFEGRYASEQMDVTGTGCAGTPPAGTIEADYFWCLFSIPDLARSIGGSPYSNPARLYTSDSTTDYYFAPKAVLEWTPAEDLLGYVSVSTGVKPGGITTVASGAWMDQTEGNGMPDGNLDERKFDAETITAYELGAKTMLLERTLMINGALFYQDYDDKQTPVQVDTGGGIIASSIENAGEAHVYGLELEAVWLPIDTVRLQLGYAYLDGEYDTLVYETNSSGSIYRAGNCEANEANNACFVDLSGNSLEDIPDHSVVALAGWYPSLGIANLSGLLEADVEYQSSRYADEFNDREVDAFSITNMRIGVQSDSWDAIVYVNNVFDDDTIRSWSSGTGVVATAERTDSNMAGFPGEGFSIAPPPRHWGVRANVRF